MSQYKFIPTELDSMQRMAVPFAVYQFVDMRVVTLALSQGFLELFGYDDHATAYDDMNNDMYRYTHPDDVAHIADAAYRFAVEDSSYDVVYRTRKPKDNGYRIVHALGRRVKMPTGEWLAYVWYTDEGDHVDDKSDPAGALRSAVNDALIGDNSFKIDHYDVLTGLPIMSYFFSLAEANTKIMIAKGEHPAILFFDLVGMKYYNTTHGFADGNRLLCAFARLLASHFGNENCARFGEDHFAVCTDDGDVENRVESIFAQWKAADAGNPIVRVGIYHEDMSDEDVSSACDMAKIACDGLRNGYASTYVYFNESMRSEIQRKQYIVENIDRAISEGWIQAYYQPIVRSVNGRVSDEEVLARWIDPTMGYISPAEFIPILEQTGLIYKLDLCIVEQALSKMKTCRDAGLYVVPQSVNLSRVDFDSCDVVEEIRRRVDASGFAHNMLSIEITESVIGSDFEFMKTQIKRFQSLGFEVWMDDFGSGYSSLDVLSSLQFQLIKFDMKFLQQLDEGASGRIILTELMRMATALGVDTICEGVETEAQVKFLREIGCSKMQGFYFTKPLPLNTVLERYKNGLQIGFENPAEAAYFESIGRVNLHDLAVLTDGQNGFGNYFNSLPMAIIEAKGQEVRLVRSNHSYREFIRQKFGVDTGAKDGKYSDILYRDNSALMNIVRQCSTIKQRAFFDEMLSDGSTVHSYARRIGINPVTGVVAIAVAVLSITDADQGTSYANIARALAADYSNLFYVNLETEQFIEYTSALGEDNIAMERQGDDFFAESLRDARRLLAPEDVDEFVAAFTKENLLHQLKEQGTFTLTYRQIIDGVSTYVNMKAMRMLEDGRYIIIGVSNVDAQMREKESAERIKEEQIAYARLAALAGDYICLYTVDPETGAYYMYNATDDFDRFGLTKEGVDFFGNSVENGKKVVYSEDLSAFIDGFCREKILDEIAEIGAYEMKYRLILDGVPTPVKLRAVMVDEDGEKRLIVGVRKRIHSSTK